MASDLAARLRARAKASREASEGATPGPWAVQSLSDHVNLLSTGGVPLRLIGASTIPIGAEGCLETLRTFQHLAHHHPQRTEASAKLAEWAADLIDADRHTELCRAVAAHHGDGRCDCGWALTLAELAAIVENEDGDAK